MVMHFSGRIVDSFDREFRCLYADSQIMDYFHNPDDEGLPTYPSYPSKGLPGMGVGMGHGLDLLSDRQRERVCSDNSSSQSSNSMSSVKAAPRMNTVYKVTQGHDRKESNNPHQNERRGSGGEERERLREERERDRLTPTPQNPSPPGTRGAPNGVTHHAPVPERPTSNYGQQVGVEWTKSSTADFLRPGLAGATSKFQAFGIYDHKPNPYHSPSPSPVSSTSGPKPTSPIGDPGKLGSKSRAPSNPLLNKLTDLFLLPSSKEKERDPYALKRSPPHSQSPAAWGGPDLSLTEPESKQSPPPPPAGGVLMNRHDQKRMTLGHSKLDLVNHYNKMKPKQAYSRFELKNNNLS